MITQNIQVLGERNPKDKLNNINLTRSVRLNDLTQEEMAKLYRRGRTNGTTGSLNQGFDFEYFFEGEAYNVSLDVVAITVDSETQAVVFDCGYSTVYNRYYRVLLINADGVYSWKERITAPAWVAKDNIKTINGESLVGTGDIEIKGGGSDGNIITIIYGKDNRNIEFYKILYNYTTANSPVSVNLQYGQWVYAATNIQTFVSNKRITFDCFMPSNIDTGKLTYVRCYLTEDGTCGMESRTSVPIPKLTPYVYFESQDFGGITNWEDNLENCGIDLKTFLRDDTKLSTAFSCYCKLKNSNNNLYQLVPFTINYKVIAWEISFIINYVGELRSYTISAYDWENLKSGTDISITYRTITATAPK